MFEEAKNGISPDLDSFPEITETIYSKVKDYPNGTELSIAIISDSIPKFIGLVREQDSIKYVENHHTLFEIGSVSKVLTSTILSNLIVEDKIDLDQSISDFFEFEIGDSLLSRVTLSQLANHTSGLPKLPTDLMTSREMYSDDPYANYGPDRLEEKLGNGIKSYSIPGTQYEYSNLGVAILGHIMTIVADKSYEGLCKRYIFEKYKMESSTSQVSSVSGRMAAALDKNGEPTSNWDLNVFVGAGGILSSTNDMSKFVLANFSSDSALALQRQVTFEVSNSTDVGLGWHINKTYDDPYYWHNGGTGGYRSMVIMNVNTGEGVVVLSNVSAFSYLSGNIDNLAYDLMEIIDQSS